MVEKGDELVKQAEKKLGISRGIFGGKLGNPEEACKLYKHAGNSYKAVQEWNKAGEAFYSCASIQKKLSDGQFEASQSFSQAALCFLKTNPEKAAKCYARAGDMALERGRFTMAAKHMLAAGEVYQNRLYDVSKALDLYTKAERFYEGEGQPAAAGKCSLKIAMLQMDNGKYLEAKERFEKLGLRAMNEKLLHWGANDHFFKAVLCGMAMDFIHGEVALKQYSLEHPSFEESREHKLCSQILAAFNNDSVEQFLAAQEQFSTINRVDAWLTKILDTLIRQVPSFTEDSLLKRRHTTQGPSYMPSSSNYTRNDQGLQVFVGEEDSEAYREVPDEELDLR